MQKKEEALSLYQKVFAEDSAEFARTFTDKYFDMCCRYIERDGKIVSMLYLLDCKVFNGDETYHAFYLYAAATDPDYRNRGLMSELLNEVLKENKVIITKPANEKLFHFYEKFGFKTCSYKDKVKKKFGAEERLNTCQYINLRKKLLENIPHIMLNDEEFALEGLTLYGNGCYCAAIDEDGETKEYIDKNVSKSKKPFAMWNKEINASFYFGIAMD